MTDLGWCAKCRAEAVVRIQLVGYCLDHLDDGFKPVGEAIWAAREALFEHITGPTADA